MLGGTVFLGRIGTIEPGASASSVASGIESSGGTVNASLGTSQNIETTTELDSIFEDIYGGTISSNSTILGVSPIRFDPSIPPIYVGLSTLSKAINARNAYKKALEAMERFHREWDEYMEKERQSIILNNSDM